MTFVSCKLLFLIFCCFKTIHVVLDEIYFEIYSERAFPAVEWGGKREKNFEEEEEKKRFCILMSLQLFKKKVFKQNAFSSFTKINPHVEPGRYLWVNVR